MDFTLPRAEGILCQTCLLASRLSVYLQITVAKWKKGDAKELKPLIGL
jgi:hypothetical protein